MKPVYIYIKYPDKDEIINDIGDIVLWWWGDKIEIEDSLKFKRWKWQRPALKKKIPTTKPKATYGVVGGILYTKDNPLAIIDGKILNHLARVFELPTHEDALVGDRDVIEKQPTLGDSRIWHLHIRGGFQFALVAGMSSLDNG